MSSLVVALLFGLAFWLWSRSMLTGAGQRALEAMPETIELARVDVWNDPAAAERLAAPLREKGFVDLGVYRVVPSAGFKLGALVNERERVAAFLCERPGERGISLELNVRYVDGTTTMLINRPDNGVPKPPFFRVIFDPSGASSAELFERLLRERSSAGIKAITATDVLDDYRAAWTRMTRWEKDRGMTAEEVSTIGLIARDGSWSPDFPDAEKARDAVEVEEEGPALRLSWRLGSSSLGAYFLLAFAYGWNRLVHFLFHLGEAGRRLPSDDYAFFALGVLPSALYAYVAIAILVNRTEVRLEGGRLTVRRGPLPWPGSRDIPAAEIDRLYSEQYVSHEGHGGGGVFHNVKLVRKNGEELVLVGGISSAAKAELIARRLGDALRR